MSIKRRSLPFTHKEGGTLRSAVYPAPPYRWIEQTPVKDVATITTWTGTQMTESENHPSWRDSHPTGDTGGAFFSQRRYAVGQPTEVHLLDERPNVRYQYDGVMLPVGTGGSPWPPYINSGNSELMAWGAKAIAACNPTNHVADLSTMLGELVSDGLPRLASSAVWKGQTSEVLRKRGSDEYLAFEFGWKPLANDMADIMSAIDHGEAAVKQYIRDSGKVVRRRFNFPTESNTEVLVTNPSSHASYRPSVSGYLTEQGIAGRPVMRIRETVRRRWFSGAFTYHIPDAKAIGLYERNDVLRNKKWGTELTPELAWELAPWSWAADWFSSAGAVVKNLSSLATDGLVMRYGYMMEHSFVKDTHSMPQGSGLLGNPQVASISFISETKMRVGASPFGFGLTLGGLTDRQQAILAALGIRRR